MSPSVQKSDGALSFPESSQAAETKLYGYTIGICVTGVAPHLPTLLTRIFSGRAAEFALKEAVIVASACDPETLRLAREAAAHEPRIKLIEHETRAGKADAINEIIRENDSEFLVFVNADALVGSRSIPVLLETIEKDKRAGVVSGRPVFDVPKGVVSEVLSIMWTSHNLLSFDRNQSAQRNHGTDELMVARRELLSELPPGVVNDGAFIAGRARAMGFTVGFQPEATVKIDLPRRMVDVIRQRRRILFGHIQVKRLVGKAPRTVETMMFFDPSKSVRIVINALAARPKLIPALPVALVGELIAVSGALWDTATERSQAVWKRYAQ